MQVGQRSLTQVAARLPVNADACKGHGVLPAARHRPLPQPPPARTQGGTWSVEINFAKPPVLHARQPLARGGGTFDVICRGYSARMSLAGYYAGGGCTLQYYLIKVLVHPPCTEEL